MTKQQKNTIARFKKQPRKLDFESLFERAYAEAVTKSIRKIYGV